MEKKGKIVIESMELDTLHAAIVRIGTALRHTKESADEMLRLVLIDSAINDQDHALDALERINESLTTAA